jgi:hypothetical protein
VVVISGSNYITLTHREFDQTIYDYHPAVTTTWVVTTHAHHFRVPRSVRVTDVRKDIRQFPARARQTALGLLRASRRPGT